MSSFKEFLLEGGNVQIGDEEAQRIDLKTFSRSHVVAIVDDALDKINQAAKRITGIPLWNDKLFKSKKFLSGSAYHFFMTKSIPDKEFVDVKSSVGDIDTQCDVNQYALIKKFLDSANGQQYGDAKLIGYKESAGQLISLWKFSNLGINVQIDLELVEFDRSGNPTDWSQFSHSSAWDDLKRGIKGYHHKMLLQALDAPKFTKMIIKAKTSRGKDKVITRGTHSFSVSHGIREKMVPVTDDKGNTLYYDGLPSYKELSTKESLGNTDLNYIFQHFFGISPNASEIKDLSSFTGIVELVKKNYPRTDWVKICDEYIQRIWGSGAQGLYRGAPQLDLDEKNKGARYICTELGVDIKKYESTIQNYYKNYR